MTNTATERVGRYQLLEPIGLGPTGSVSRAKVFGVAGFERQFAIKRFHGDLTSQLQIATALSAAARAYGGLEHPRIARMSEFGIAQGTTYTAVEFVNGLDALRLITEVRVASTTLAAGGALALVSQAARAVGYAHGRGLTHLGLSPTNVVITPEGDVKITDFGILSATLPSRPVEVPRLAQRIAYLAPEQIAGEATSAATDVFALGVLAYELVTGERLFEGSSAAEIAKSVATQPPPEPSLPRPIVRVIQRCLARSPFERFPDARALADALDAALRVAPVPGTRKDIGAEVKQILDRLADLHSGELSGILSLNMGTANLGGPIAPVAALGAPRESELDLATIEFVRPDTPVAGPTPLVGPAIRPTRRPADDDGLEAEQDALPTLPPPPRGGPKPMSKELKVPPSTVPGLAPPPIQVPANIPAIPPPLPPLPGKPLASKSIPIPKPLVGAVPPPRPGQGPTRPAAVHTNPPDRPSESPVSPLKMMASAPTGSAPAVPISRTMAVPDPKKQLFGALRPDTDAAGAARTDLVIETDPGDLDLDGERTELPAPHPRPSQSQPLPSLSVEMEIVDPGLDEVLAEIDGPIDRPTDEISPLLRDQLALQAARKDEWQPRTLDEISAPNQLPEPPPEPPRKSGLDGPPERRTLAGVQPSRSLSQPLPPAPAPSASRPGISESRLSASEPPMIGANIVAARRSKAPVVAAAILGVMAAGAGAYVGYDLLSSGGSGSGSAAIADAPVVATTPDAAVVAITSPDAARADPPAPDAAHADPPAPDAAAAPADAAQVAADAPTADPAPSDSLSITSTPPGAHVYLDGSESGVTPLKLPGSPDKHTIALFSPGHELYVASVKGSGAYAIPLKEVTPSGGPAGIKVTKCAKERYYVFVDGKPTGMVCPTERIEVDLGSHTVEVYDMVTEARKQFPVVVKDTRLSVRVRIE